MGRCPQRPQIQIGKSHGKDLRNLHQDHPGALWEAITNSEIRSKYQFGNTFTSDWTPGSRFEMHNVKADAPLGEGENIEVDPPHAGSSKPCAHSGVRM